MKAYHCVYGMIDVPTAPLPEHEQAKLRAMRQREDDIKREQAEVSTRRKDVIDHIRLDRWARILETMDQDGPMMSGSLTGAFGYGAGAAVNAMRRRGMIKRVLVRVPAPHSKGYRTAPRYEITESGRQWLDDYKTTRV